MKNLKFKIYYSAFFVAIAIFLILILASCGPDDKTDNQSSEMTILGLLESEPNYNSFSELIDLELKSELNDPELTFTLFVSKDPYLDSIEYYTGYESLNKDIPAEERQNVLQYHVVPGRGIWKNSFQNRQALTTNLSGEQLAVQAIEDWVKLNDVEVDLESVKQASNGLVYTIDGLLVPNELRVSSVLGILLDESLEDLSQFIKLWTENIPLIRDEKGITVFAPTDMAIREYLVENGLNKLDDLSEEEKKILFNFHVVTESLEADELFSGQELETALGQSLVVGSINSEITLSASQATLIESNLVGLNGIVHKINRVLEK